MHPNYTVLPAVIHLLSSPARFACSAFVLLLHPPVSLRLWRYLCLYGPLLACSLNRREKKKKSSSVRLLSDQSLERTDSKSCFVCGRHIISKGVFKYGVTENSGMFEQWFSLNEFQQVLELLYFLNLGVAYTSATLKEKPVET